MSVSTDFIAYLNTQSSITDLVGNRICQAPAHERERLPYIVFVRNGRSQDTDLNGDKDNDRTFLDLECRGSTQDSAEQVADALHTLLHGKRFTWNGRRIQGVFVTDQEDNYVNLPQGSNEHEEIITSRIEIISE